MVRFLKACKTCREFFPKWSEFRMRNRRILVKYQLS